MLLSMNDRAILNKRIIYTLQRILFAYLNKKEMQ